jgi:hypothetical protein
VNATVSDAVGWVTQALANMPLWLFAGIFVAVVGLFWLGLSLGGKKL